MRKHSLLIGNWITFSIVYFMMIFYKFGQLKPSTLYLYLYFLILVYNSVSSIYYHKYQTVLQKSFWLTLRIIFWSNFISALFIIITVSFTQLWTISREFIFITLIILFLLEIFISAIIFKYTHKTTRLIGEFTKDKNHLVYRYNIKWLITGATTLIVVYGILLFFQTKQLAMYVQDEQNLLLLIGAWGISTLLTNRYKYPNSVNHYYEIAPYIKASIIGILFIILFYFSLRLNTQDVTIIFMSSLIHSSIEIFSFYLYFFGQNKNHEVHPSPKNHLSTDNDDQRDLNKNLSVNEQKNRFTYHDLIRSLYTIQLENKNEVIQFLSSTFEKENIKKDRVTIFDTISTTNIEILYNNSQDLLVNLHNINNLRRINHYFINSYNKLSTGGLLVGSFIPLENFDSHLRGQMPHFLYAIMLPFHFIFHRIFPKLAITKQIYFILTDGKNRTLSKAEIFGRLSFCGFKMEKYETIGNQIYFTCKKSKTISEEQSPSYGPIVKLKRIGHHGRIINIYKFRTMYPFSEFIQKDVFEENNLDASGKFLNDFRITSWGRILRKYFIDEIPQLYNWLRSDINLVGVRAISKHYYSLYPKDLKELRINFKPGLIPPYYADMPTTFEEIVESEVRYLQKKKEKPIVTNMIYFVKALINIIFSGARSK
jgi:lipopolysaccharide/colanic/teichoic acid biosynthesis glycosyltransferase